MNDVHFVHLSSPPHLPLPLTIRDFINVRMLGLKET